MTEFSGVPAYTAIKMLGSYSSSVPEAIARAELQPLGRANGG